MYVMNICKGVILALFFLVHPSTMFTSQVPTVNYPVDSFAISCGSSSRMIASDGRAWLEDVGLISSSFHSLSGKSITSDALHQAAKIVDPTPYNKARISHHEFTYTFHVRPGQKFIRLHFFPAAYKGFQKSTAIFSVKVCKFTLLTNFSPTLEVVASAETIIVKEFCVNIKENQVLDIVFSPFVQQKSKDIYAFINGIEIVSMPAGLYFTRDSDLGAEVVGQKYKFYIDNATALEMVKRLNIGGNFIPPVEDESTFRGWDSDFNRLSQSDYGQSLWTPDFGTSFGSIFVNLNLRRLTERSSDVRSLSSQCHQFSLDEIRSTTNNFHHEYLIGSGGYGKVYKGRVSSNGGTLVAIKRLKPESRQGENEFWVEIEMLSKLQHANLVSLIGYCNESQELLLIYQYMNRGTLEDHLYKIAAKGIFHPPLSWDQRLKISIGAATGLWYLHEQRIIHRDVKSSNILIDENWVAKISDFGLSKMGPTDESLLSHVSTDVKGTFGYLCPEYFLTRMLSFKSDVYAFGVVLLEVLTGRPAVDMRLPDDQYSLAAWAKNCIRNGNVEGIIDPTLLRQIAPACLTKYVEIAQRCLRKVPRERPSMLDVVRHLDSALLSQQRPDSDDVKEVGEIYNDGSTSLDDTTSLIAETIPSVTEDYISSTSSTGNDGNISKSAKPELKEKDFSSIVPSKKLWNLFHYFRRSPKNYQKSPENPQRSSVSQHGPGNLSIKEILTATNNFGNSFHINFPRTEVCKGQTDDGKRVVVLRSYFENKTPPTMQELQSILGVFPSENHAPAASLVGYYADKHNVILMFDDIELANSSLQSHLYNPISEPLSWKQRLMICIDIAKVHKSLMAVRTQFWNLTSANIFLDENFATKIEIFSAASEISTTDRLVDSHHIRDEHTREKASVSCFGRLLSEVLCPDSWFETNPDNTIGHQIMANMNTNHTPHVDQYLIGKALPESLKIYLEITSRCLHRLGRERPSFSKIVSMLEMALQLQEATEDNHDIQEES